MTDLYSQLHLVANQLQAEGKTPSLALIRARLKGQDPVQLFSAYQQWRNSSATTNTVANQLVHLNSKAVENQTLAEPVEQTELQQLRSDVARLEHKIDQLLQLITSQGTSVDVGR